MGEPMRSDWHFGRDYDMWLYPPVKWEPDYYYEPPEPIEAADIQGTLLINADYAIEQVRKLQAENAKLRELVSGILAYGYHGGFLCADSAWSCPHFQECFNCPIEEGPEKYVRRGCRWLALARELGIEVC